MDASRTRTAGFIVGVLLACLGIIAALPAGANAAVGATYTGWGYTVSPVKSEQVAAWRWDGAQWQAASRAAQRQVYIQPFASGWSWMWERSSGWMAISSAHLRPGLIPGPENTGVPPGAITKYHQGDLTITTAGTIIDGWDISGNVYVKAPNVTIRRSFIHGREPAAGTSGLVTNYNAANTNLLIEDTTIAPRYPGLTQEGFKGANVTMRRVEITNAVDAFGVHGNNVRIESSWFHDLTYFKPCPFHADGQSHNDDVQIHSGSNIMIRGNTMNSSHNAAIMVNQSGRVSDVTIDGNWFDGGACTINVWAGDLGPFQRLAITNNRFGLGVAISGCAITIQSTTRATTTVSGNVWDYSGGAVTARTG